MKAKESRLHSKQKQRQHRHHAVHSNKHQMQQSGKKHHESSSKEVKATKAKRRNSIANGSSRHSSDGASMTKKKQSWAIGQVIDEKWELVEKIGKVLVLVQNQLFVVLLYSI